MLCGIYEPEPEPEPEPEALTYQKPFLQNSSKPKYRTILRR